MASQDRASAPAVSRAAKILSHLAAASGAQRLTAIASAVKIPVSSTAAICNALEDERMIARVSGGYVLGPRNVELAQRFLAQLHPLSSFADAIAAQQTLRRETVQMAMLDGSDMLYVARRDGEQPIVISSAVGKRLPVNCTAVGKASLALIPADERRLPDPLVGMTDRSLTDPDALDAVVAETAARGYAIDDEEASIGVICIAVARQTARREIYAISATLLKLRHTPELEAVLVEDLSAAADALFPPALGQT